MSLDDYKGEELLHMWRESGLSQRELASRLGLPFDAMHGMIFRAQQDEVGEGDVNVEETGNTMRLSSKSYRIKTKDDLVETCGVDLDDWVIEKSRIKTYEGYRRDEKKDLEFVDGRITGSVVDNGELTIEPLFSVEVWLARRNPIALHPIVQPVVVKANIPRKPLPKTAKRLDLSVFDAHFGYSRDWLTGKLTPFHDRKALSLVLQIAGLYEFDNIIIGGDMFDLAEMSTKFARTPDMQFTTQPALIECSWFLQQLMLAAPTAKLWWLQGNHEKRLTDLLMQHALQAYELRSVKNLNMPVMSIPYLLDLDGMGIEYVSEYPGEKYINNVRYIHGVTVKGKSGHTVASLLDEAQDSTICGHGHRREIATKTLRGKKPREITAMMPGCLCHTDGRVPSARDHENWQKGVGIVTSMGFYPIPIMDDKADLFGDVVEAYDYLPQLQQDTKETGVRFEE